MTTIINATVERGTKYWIAQFTIDGIEYGTQARNYRDLEGMVKDAAALMTDRPLESFEVTLTLADKKLAHIVEEYQKTDQERRIALEAFSQSSRQAVSTLRRDGISTRDTAALLGITPGRVSQLAHA